MKRQRREIRCHVCGGPAEQERVLVDIELAARLCRVSRVTLYRWMKRDLVEWAELTGGRRRLYLDSLFRDPIIPQEIMPANPPRPYRRRKPSSTVKSSRPKRRKQERARIRGQQTRSTLLLRSRSALKKLSRGICGKEGRHA